MKNKKWKRKAKRLYGYCISTGCHKCSYHKLTLITPFETDYDCCAPSYLPCNTGIRAIEKEIRGRRDIKCRNIL